MSRRPSVRRGASIVVLLAVLQSLFGCAAPSEPDRVVLSFPTSAVGAEAEVLERQLQRFVKANPDIAVERQITPDASDQRRQLFVQWLNAGLGDPDVLQLDVIWTAEFAAAGWILPLRPFAPDTSEFFPATMEANTWQGELFALPWFVDVGMLYYRKDLLAAAPRSLEELEQTARAAVGSGGVRYGMVWQAARYEGLITVFVELLAAHGGAILDEYGRVAVASEAGVAALEAMRAAMADGGYVPRDALSWQEEQTRLAFQAGRAAYMRNWPYAAALMQKEGSAVAGQFGVAPMPASRDGSPSAALGGQQLAINARSEHPEAAYRLIEFLTLPEQMLERAEIAGQLPSRPGLYGHPRLAAALPVPPGELKSIVEHARPRPPTPIYSELSEILQIEVHRALVGHTEPRQALEQAARQMEALIERYRLDEGPQVASREPSRSTGSVVPLAVGVVAVSVLAALVFLLFRRGESTRARALEARQALYFMAPALLVMVCVALVPLCFTLYESLHGRDLRMPWRGREFVGLDNYVEALTSSRVLGAFGRTAFFTVVTVALELVLGLTIAFGLNRAFRARGAARALALLPWALPTVVAALVFRLLFDGPTSFANTVLVGTGFVEAPIPWLGHEIAAWVPLLLADVWKTAPFVALLLLAGLQSIDPQVYEAARVDGATARDELFRITLPLLKPALLVACIFRTLDAIRVFDLVYALTGGGPGTATEPVALLTFTALLGNLRFGFGSALSVLLFVAALGFAYLYLRLIGRGFVEEES